jgi:hypothetical protein
VTSLVAQGAKLGNVGLLSSLSVCGSCREGITQPPLV